MATYYVGHREILRGRNTKDFVHPYKGVGTYSNYQLHDTGSKVFTGAPDTNYTLGDRRHAGILEYIYAGKHHTAPMKGAGDGTRLSYHRTHPHENKAAGGQKVFSGTWGHADRVTSYSAYSNFVHDGVNVEPLKNAGHARRFNTTYGGASDPHRHQGVRTAMSGTVGQALPSGYDNDYGKNKVNEFQGIRSAL
jgi:hypothetical protein